MDISQLVSENLLSLVLKCISTFPSSSSSFFNKETKEWAGVGAFLFNYYVVESYAVCELEGKKHSAFCFYYYI